LLECVFELRLNPARVAKHQPVDRFVEPAAAAEPRPRRLALLESPGVFLVLGPFLDLFLLEILIEFRRGCFDGWPS